MRGRRKPSVETLKPRQLLAVTTFQQGVGGYAGQEDTVLYSRESDVNFGTEGSISPDQQDANGVRQGLVRFSDIIGDTPSQAWANESLDNCGWSIVYNSGSLWAFNSSEAFLVGTFKPELTILYTDPVPAEQGTLSLSVDDYVAGEADADVATVTVNRIGGSTGPATLNWEITPRTGDLDDISSPSTGSLLFAERELYKTFDVAIVDDDELESNETSNITLSRAGIDFGRDEGSAWFGGDLFPAGDDYLLYETDESFFLPVTGAAMTPGEPNTGDTAESPLLTLVDVTPNANGTVTVAFSGDVDQLNAGDGGLASPGGAGVTITLTLQKSVGQICNLSGIPQSKVVLNHGLLQFTKRGVWRQTMDKRLTPQKQTGYQPVLRLLCNQRDY